MQFKAKKSLGQHFLFHKDLCSQIVASSAPIAGKVVVEVGPGYGTLSQAILAKNPSAFFMIEKDAKLAALLKDKYCSFPNATVIHADALRVDLMSLTHENIVIISNLPYNIGTQLVCNWLGSLSGRIEHMTLMLQKEVVSRICGTPGSANYGRLSLFCQLLADCVKDFDVPAHYFTPPPQVMSAILQITPKNQSVDTQVLANFEKIIKAAFIARRKIIKSSLRDFFTAPELERLGIDPTIRPQDLWAEQFWLLAQNIAQ